MYLEKMLPDHAVRFSEKNLHISTGRQEWIGTVGEKQKVVRQNFFIFPKYFLNISKIFHIFVLNVIQIFPPAGPFQMFIYVVDQILTALSFNKCVVAFQSTGNKLIRSQGALRKDKGCSADKSFLIGGSAKRM